jgi:CO/xanthine dehydrogenase Mo-binding subunit
MSSATLRKLLSLALLYAGGCFAQLDRGTILGTVLDSSAGGIGGCPFAPNATGNILTASLADYLPPTAREIPPIEIHHLETLTEASLTKAKGLGEGGAIGPPAAVVNAINDALSPFGVSIDEFPATPQRIRAALRAASAWGQA